jgi:hypothetical protein
MDEVTIALSCRDNLRVATIHIILSLSQEEEKSENPMHFCHCCEVSKEAESEA